MEESPDKLISGELALNVTVNNETFLRAIFGVAFSQAHVTSFREDPGNIPSGRQGLCWAGGSFGDSPLLPDSNQFYAVSLFNKDENGRSRRRKAEFLACYVIGLDDVREKLPIEQVKKLPPPSIVLKSSLYSEQWLYLLRVPETNASRVDKLHDGLIASGLAPDSKDPGQKGVTRYLRLPEGVNTKAKRISANGGVPPKCEIVQWFPSRKYALEDLAAPFGVDLTSAGAAKKPEGATTMPDHPLLNTEALSVNRECSPGTFDITCPWVAEHTGADDSGSAMFTNSDGSIGFKCHHGNCHDRTGSDLLSFIEGCEPGFKDRLKKWATVRSFADLVDESTLAPICEKDTSPINRLRSVVANGSSDNMKKQMLADKFVLKNLAILGQWTVFYAGPNTGKTLLVIWLLREQIRSGELDGGNVFYANCDDTYRGGAEKLRIAEQVGFQMLIPNVKGFRPDSLLSIMKEIAESGEAQGTVIVLDTLKKFTDLMDKRMSSQFGDIARQFVSAGGSLLCLAHVNKHRNSDGKSIYSGTSDIRDDADCVFNIEQIGDASLSNRITYTVQFECNKSRGDVADKLAFQYSKPAQGGYVELFESVARVGLDVANAAKKSVEEEEKIEIDASVIEKIKAAIENEQFIQSQIISFVASTAGIGSRQVRRVLGDYEGKLWDVQKGANNASIYRLKGWCAHAEVSFL